MTSNIFHEKLFECKNSTEFGIIITDEDGDTLAEFKHVDFSNNTIKLLTQWRNEFFDSFFDKFPATEERTKKWLKEQVIEKEGRILFIIWINGQIYGHMGINRYNQEDNSAEIDNVVRGIQNKHSNLMKNATIALMTWMYKELGLSKILVECWSDNYPAVNLYLGLIGFKIVEKIPFRKKTTDNGWKWVETTLNENDSGKRYVVKGEIKPDKFFKLHTKI